jgi:hypothetical protein
MNKPSLKWCTLVGIAITFLSLLPQLHLWYARGSQWQGAYATVDGDEFLYSAYLNALIDGRPRRNDPFSGRDDNPNTPVRESAYSIQVIPAFVISSLAKISGASASTAFIVLIGVAGLLASVAVFWFLLSVTGDYRTAGVGTLFVLCLGGPAAGQGLLGVLLNADVTTLGLPFLRRYNPSASFSLFFVFSTLIWRALVIDNNKRARLYAALGGLVLGALIFCYFFLWTAAAAWVTCCTLLWFYFRPVDRGRTLQVLAVVGVTALFALGPYAYLLSHRATDLDQTQLLVSTHRLDPFRVPEIIGALVLVVLVVAARRDKLKMSRPVSIFAASFAVLPFVIFNQQVVTGRSLQPFHFENFIANYAVLVAVVILFVNLRPQVSPRRLRLIMAVCLLWGVIEVDLAARARYTSNVANDEVIPALQRLRELSMNDGTRAGLRSEGKTPAVVFSPHTDVMRLVPTWTAQGILLGVGGLEFGSVSRRDAKVYTYLYYCGADGQFLRELLQDKGSDRFMNYYARTAIFGHPRVLSKLTFDYRPIQDTEIEEQVRAYESYVASFSQEAALKHPIAYAIVRRDSAFDFSRIDLWYQRDAGESMGAYDLYRLRLRT